MNLFLTLFYKLPVLESYILLVRSQGFVGGTNDFIDIFEFFESVGTPADDTGGCKNRCIKSRRKIKHAATTPELTIEILNSVF